MDGIEITRTPQWHWTMFAETVRCAAASVRSLISRRHSVVNSFRLWCTVVLMNFICLSAHCKFAWYGMIWQCCTRYVNLHNFKIAQAQFVKFPLKPNSNSISLSKSSTVSTRFLTCIPTCSLVSISICLRLNLPTVHNLSLPSYTITPSFSYHE